jgi:hypothetical protein
MQLFDIVRLDPCWTLPTRLTENLLATGWVVDTRHDLDEETGDLTDAIPETPPG